MTYKQAEELIELRKVVNKIAYYLFSMACFYGAYYLTTPQGLPWISWVFITAGAVLFLEGLTT